jgi:hypothetical protein
MLHSLVSEPNTEWQWVANPTSGQFSKDIKIGSKYIKKCSTSIKEMQIKTTLRFHPTPVRRVIIKKTNSNKCWRGYGKDEPFYTWVGMKKKKSIRFISSLTMSTWIVFHTCRLALISS